jgi:hypothetical protein
MVAVTPDFYDATGNMLASGFDLPSDRVTAGIAVAGADEREVIVTWAGEEPLQVQATVSKGNVFLYRYLDRNESAFFKRSIKRGRVVLVLAEVT